MPDIVEAVAGKIPVLVDGGFRRGSHVVKALCLGAACCLVARPQLWGLAVGGEAGVAHVLDIFRREIDRSMALMGASRIADLTADMITVQHTVQHHKEREMPKFPIVDAHVHLYDVKRFSYGWLANVPKINRSYGLEDFDKARGPVVVDKLVFAEVAVDPGPASRRGGFHPGTGRPRSRGFAASLPMRRWKRA